MHRKTHLTVKGLRGGSSIRTKFRNGPVLYKTLEPYLINAIMVATELARARKGKKISHNEEW